MNPDAPVFDDDYYGSNKAIEVSLLWLIRNIDHSVDFGPMDTFDYWCSMFREKTSDTGFGHLVDSMLTRGFMPKGAIGFDQGCITEGHHRLCAAIMLGLDTVWISCYGGRVNGGNNSNLVTAHWCDDDPYPLQFCLTD